MRRLAVIWTVLVILTGSACAALYLLLSANSVAKQVAESVERSTGRTLSFDSGARLRLWPEFGVSFSGVRLSNPPSVKDGVFAEAETMRVEIGLAALLGQRAEIEEIKLINPTINLVIDATGRGNWDFAAADGDAAAAALQPLYVEGGTVQILDERSGETHVFQRLDLVVTLEQPGGAVGIKGSGDWLQDRVSFWLFLRSPQFLAGEGTPIDLNVSGSWLNFAFSGQASFAKSFELAGTVEGGTRSMRRLMRWAGVKIGDGKGLGAVQARGALSVTGDSLELSKAEFSLGGMRGTGDMAVSFAGARPKLNATIAVDALDLNQYTAAAQESGDEGEGVEGWSNADLDFSSLNALDASVRLKAARLIYGRALLADAAIEATLAEGILNAKLGEAALYGGKVDGQVVLNGKQKLPTVQASFQGSGLDGDRLMRNVGNFSWIEGGCDFAVAFAATGRSQREMIASLRGTAAFAFKDGKVKEVDVAKIAEAVSKNVHSGWIMDKAEATAFRQLQANFTVADGIAESKQLLVEGTEVRLKGEGVVDLLKRELDLKIDGEIAQAEGANAGFIVPIVVKGPWGKPKFYPDIAGVLENPQAAYATLKTLVRKATLDGDAAPAGEADELLSSSGEGGADLLKKQINSDGLDVMNGFAGEATPDIVPAEQ